MQAGIAHNVRLVARCHPPSNLNHAAAIAAFASALDAYACGVSSQHSRAAAVRQQGSPAPLQAVLAALSKHLYTQGCIAPQREQAAAHALLRASTTRAQAAGESTGNAKYRDAAGDSAAPAYTCEIEVPGWVQAPRARNSSGRCALGAVARITCDVQPDEDIDAAAGRAAAAAASAGSAPSEPGTQAAGTQAGMQPSEYAGGRRATAESVPPCQAGGIAWACTPQVVADATLLQLTVATAGAIEQAVEAVCAVLSVDGILHDRDEVRLASGQAFL